MKSRKVLKKYKLLTKMGSQEKRKRKNTTQIPIILTYNHSLLQNFINKLYQQHQFLHLEEKKPFTIY